MPAPIWPGDIKSALRFQTDVTDDTANYTWMNSGYAPVAAGAGPFTGAQNINADIAENLMTVDIWALIPAGVTTGTIYSSDNGTKIYLQDGQLYISQDYVGQAGGITIPNDIKFRIQITFDGEFETVYLNGDMVAEQQYDGYPTGPQRIGNDPAGGDPLAGYIIQFVISVNNYQGAEIFATAPYSSAATIFNKNRLQTDGAMIMLMEITVPGLDETMRIARNTENISWHGYTWQAYPFQIDDINENTKGEMPVINIQVSNITREVQSYLEQTNGSIDTEITIYIVNAKHLDDNVPLWQADYALMQASCDENYITFQCGMKYQVNSRRPIFRNIKYICPFKYGGIVCGAPAGTFATYPTCNKDIGSCQARSNAARFGGELSIPGDYVGN